MKMFIGILRFEWRYHTRQVAFAVACTGVTLAGFMLVASGYGPPGVHINSPYSVMQSLGLLSLLCVFVLTIFCSNAALRDIEHGMTELMFVKPIGKPRYVLGRFAGAIAAGITVMLVAALVMMVAPLLVHFEAGRTGAVRPMAYAWALIILVLPNVLLAGALLYAVATLTRSTLATYVGAVAIYALYIVCAMLVDSPLLAGAAPPTAEGLARAALLDPFGLSAFFEQTRYWTPAERNTRLVSLSGHMLLNRLVWTGVAGAVVTATYAAFQFRLGSGRKTRVAPNGTSIQGAGVRSAVRHRATAPDAAAPYRPVTPSDSRAFMPALRSAFRLELRHVLKGWTFLALLALWAFVAVTQGVAQLSGGEYGSRLIPTTSLMIEATHIPLMLLATITIIYYAAEIAWRERAVRISSLVDATPSASGVFYLAKLAALCALPLIMLLVGFAVGMLIQLTHGYSDLQPSLYAAQLLFAGLPLVLLATAVFALQAVLPNRWVGMIAGLVLGLVAQQGQALGLYHPMLRFSAAPPIKYSDMAGFGSTTATFAAFMLFWSAVAFALGCIAWGLWRRGMDDRLRLRISAMHATLGRAGMRLGAIALAVFIATGATLYHQTNMVHNWVGRDADESWRAEYEQKYRRLAGLPQPEIVGVRTHVDLFPEKQRAAITGVYSLVNMSPLGIDTVWVSIRRDVISDSLAIAGASVTSADKQFGMYAFALPKPLAPGDSTHLAFSFHIDRGGIRADAVEHDVASNGSYFRNQETYPSLGYRTGYELGEPRTRTRYGLPPEPSAIALLDTAGTIGSAERRNSPWIMIDATISTSQDQIAVGVGRLEKTWQQGSRRFFHYVTEAPVTPLFAFASGRYATRRETHGGVDIEILYHPAHTANIDRMMAAASRSIDVLGASFGTYPQPSLRIIETPSWSNFGAFALPGVVFFREDGGFLSDPGENDVDLVTRRIAHEVGHQWWGHLVDPADVEGASTIVETLAKYSEQLVVAAMHGERALPPLLAYDEDRYLAGRALDAETEPTLMTTTGQAYMYYGKGAVAVNALHQLLGAERMNSALRRLIALQAGPLGAATTTDLRNALRAEAKTSDERRVVDEWMGDHIVYDMRIDTVTWMVTASGRHRLTARISVSKSRQQGTVDATIATDGEMFDVALYEGDPSESRMLYEGRLPARNGRIDFGVEAAGKPLFIVIDPRITKIDRNRSDNVKRIRE